MPAGTIGNSEHLVTAFHAVVQHLYHGRRYTRRTNQVQRSFEDASLKQHALELVAVA